ncbi:MAG: phage portal protein [Candidatus Nitrosopelagicus sp.]|nr:phage portal protein [Candidatus Nitrosopelagicus sp.]
MGILDSITNIFSTNSEKRASSYVNPNWYFANSGSGAIVNKETALGFTPVFNAVKLLSESVSQIPVEICETLPDGDVIKRTEHPLTRILTQKPNPNQTKVSFFSKIMVDLCLDGNSYVYIERNGAGVPTNLYCLNTDDVTMTKNEMDIFYTVGDDNQMYASNEILHFRTLSTDGYLGISPIAQCKTAIGWGIAVETYGNTFFKNGAKLSGVLSTDRQMSELAIERLKTSFQEQYAALNDANKTLILEEGLKFQQISISNEQAQFLASRDMAIQEVARVYNIPPHMLKDLSKSSFNNIEQQSTEFVRYSVQPYLANLESEMNLKLFKQSEQGKMFTNFDANGLLRGSPNDRADFYEKMVNIGAMTINEVREKENMNAVESGDELYLPKGMDTIQEINKEESDA